MWAAARRFRRLLAEWLYPAPRGEEEALPLFFALYDLKTSQRLDEQEGGWEQGQGEGDHGEEAGRKEGKEGGCCGRGRRQGRG